MSELLAVTERDLLLAVLASSVGFDVGLFGMLYLRPLEDGSFAVGGSQADDSGQWEAVFDDAGDAVDHFIRCRHKRELGYDHEVQS